MSNDEPPPQPTVNTLCPGLLSQQQLLRSKSLNDISNDSQISVFASDRFINVQNPGANSNAPQQNQQQTQNQCNNVSTTRTGSGYMPMMDPLFGVHQQDVSKNNVNNIINQQHQQRSHYNNTGYNNVNNHQHGFTNVYTGSPTYGNSFNSNQCSKPVVAPATNVFNLCNPLTVNLNSVTEQIGNFHL